MKGNCAVLLAGLAAFAIPDAALAVFPVPVSPVVTYGLVRDEFGSPYGASSRMALTLVPEENPDGKAYAETTVTDIGSSGHNYVLQLEIDSAGPVRPYAVLAGTRMRIRAKLGGEETSLAPAPVFVTPAAGTAQRLDFTTGEDLDNDGLPDAWERLMMAYNEKSGQPGQPTTIGEFLPNGDCDGDGMSNAREYLAGTDPFLSTDLLAIVRFEPTSVPFRAAVRFTTAEGRKYRLLRCDDLANPVWLPVATSRKADGDLAVESYVGTGREMTVYLEIVGKSEFYRIGTN